MKSIYELNNLNVLKDTYSLYENSKIRPIISKIGTTIYRVARKLNDILVKYMPGKNYLDSISELIDLINDIYTTVILVSLEGENLFRTVPAKPTIKVIFVYAYSHREYNTSKSSKTPPVYFSI